MAQTNAATEVERLAHYRDLAAQFRGWAESEQNADARASLLDLARQYDRLIIGLADRIDAALRAKRD